jgi:hypothetical protein
MERIAKQNTEQNHDKKLPIANASIQSKKWYLQAKNARMSNNGDCMKKTYKI